MKYYALFIMLFITLFGCAKKSAPPSITGAYTFHDGSVVYSLSDGKAIPITAEEMQKIKDGIERVERPKVEAKGLEELIQESEMLRDRALATLQKTQSEVTEVLEEIRPEHTKNVSEINRRLTEVSDLLVKSNAAEKDLRDTAAGLQARAKEFTEAKESVSAVEANMTTLQENVAALEKNLRMTQISLDDLGSLVDQSTVKWNEQFDRSNILASYVDQQRQAQSSLLAEVGEIDKSNTELEDRIAELHRKNERLSADLESARQQSQEIQDSVEAPLPLPPTTSPQRKYTYYDGYVAPATSAPATSAPAFNNSTYLTPTKLSGIARSQTMCDRWGLAGIGPLFEDTSSGMRISFQGTFHASHFLTACQPQHGDPDCLSKCMRILHPNDQFIISCTVASHDPSKVVLSVRPTQNGRYQQQKATELTHMLGHVITTMKANF